MSSEATFSNSTSKSYALAFYELSQENSVLDKAEQEMISFKELLNASIDFKKMLVNPMLTKEDKGNVLLKIVEENLNNYKCVAVGEIGLDKHWDLSYLKQQKIAFQSQIDIAKEKDLPIVIHCRDAFNDIYDILIKNKSDKLRGILHCFTGSLDDAKKIIDLNFKIGIGGVVTFKNGGIDKFLNKIDISNIVLETDSPYLSPTPHRGKRNESSYITYVIDKLSEIYDLPTLDIISQTSLNANDVFDFNN